MLVGDFSLLRRRKKNAYIYIYIYIYTGVQLEGGLLRKKPFHIHALPHLHPLSMLALICQTCSLIWEKTKRRERALEKQPCGGVWAAGALCVSGELPPSLCVQCVWAFVVSRTVFSFKRTLGQVGRESGQLVTAVSAS